MWNGGAKTKQFLIQKKSPGKSFRAGKARNFMKSVLIKILAPVCAVMIAASLSACGEKSSSSAESSKAESSAAAETTKATEASKATETAAPTTAEADDTTDGELKTGAVDEKTGNRFPVFFRSNFLSETELLENGDDVGSLLPACILHHVVSLPVADGSVRAACQKL